MNTQLRDGQILDADIVEEDELGAGRDDTEIYPGAFPVSVASTVSSTKTVEVFTGNTDTWRLSAGDVAVISGGTAAGTYTVAGVTDATHFTIEESIPDSTSEGQLTVYFPPGVNQIGFDHARFTHLHGTDTPTVMAATDNAALQALLDVHALGEDTFDPLTGTFYAEFTYTGKEVTRIDIWEDNTKTTVLRTLDLTWTNGKITELVASEPLDSGVSGVATKTVTYAGDLLESINSEYVAQLTLHPATLYMAPTIYTPTVVETVHIQPATLYMAPTIYTPTVTVDTTNFITIQGPTGTTGDTTPTYFGTTDPNSSVEVDIDSGAHIANTTADGSGNWSVTPSYSLGHGSHSFVATSTDPSNNVASDSQNFFVDNSTFISISSPSNGAELNDSTPTFSGTGESSSSVQLSVGGDTYNGTTDGSGNWTLTATNALTDGGYTATATITDDYGNTAQDSVSITIDTSTFVNISSPSDGATLTDSTPTFSGTGEGSSSVQLSVGGDTYNGTTDSGGNWTLTATNALSDGNYTATVTITDDAGNTAQDSISITIDTTNFLTISSPAEGSTTSDRTPTFSGTTDPNSTVELTVGGSSNSTTADGSGNWSFVPFDFGPGDNTFTVNGTSTDPAGNTANDSVTFTVDTVTNVSISSPADGATVNTATPTYSGTGEVDGEVQVYVDGSSVGNTQVDGSGNWSVTQQTPLADGAHTVQADINDPYGNTDSDSHNFTVST